MNNITLCLDANQAVFMLALLERVEDNSDFTEQVSGGIMHMLLDAGVPCDDSISALIWLYDDVEQSIKQSVKNWKTRAKKTEVMASTMAVG